MKWVEQEDHRAIGRPSLMRIASEGQFSGRWMREFRVPCTRKQRREGVTVHSYHGAMPCLMHTGEHGAWLSADKASEYQCPEEQNPNTQGL